MKDQQTMAGFNKVEKRIAKGLENFPFVRRCIKEFYKRSVYMFFLESGFKAELNDKCILKTPQEWAGLPKTGGEWFFGYYDKSPWSADMNLSVFHKFNNDTLSIMVIDQNSGKEYSIGETTAWNWQQGAMAQWVPDKYEKKVIFNTVKDGILGSRIVHLEDGNSNFIKWPIQTLHPNGKKALTLNYRRLQVLRPDYGYRVKAKNFVPDQPLDKDGIWQVNLKEGTGHLMVSIAKLSAYKPVAEMKNARHKVNHIIYSPSGKRFIFLYRFIGPKGKFSRLFTAESDGSELRLLLDNRMVSHYHFRDEDHIIAWGRTEEDGDRYYLIDANSGKYEIVGQDILDNYGDGHCTFSPDGRWLLTDTYPDRARQRKLLLYDMHTNAVILIGRFFSPWKYDDTFRCDLHPRFSPDARWISFDSVHEGKRNTYFVDISAIIDAAT